MLRILLVDDSEDSRLLVPALLKKGPFVVETAENGQVALERLISGEFDLVLMDMQMPVMDGFDATRAIRAREAAARSSRRLPVIAMTAYEHDEERARMKEVGCDAYLNKPFRREELFALIEKFTAGAAPAP
jgi:CheY-like chemotaxis protein